MLAIRSARSPGYTRTGVCRRTSSGSPTSNVASVMSKPSSASLLHATARQRVRLSGTVNSMVRVSPGARRMSGCHSAVSAKSRRRRAPNSALASATRWASRTRSRGGVSRRPGPTRGDPLSRPCSTSPADSNPCASIFARSIASIGEGPSPPLNTSTREIREPVISIRSRASSPALKPSAGDASCCITIDALASPLARARAAAGAEADIGSATGLASSNTTCGRSTEAASTTSGCIASSAG